MRSLLIDNTSSSLIYIQAILLYEYLLTIVGEIEHFWKRARFSLASLLFVINRYSNLLGHIVVVLAYFQHHSPHVNILTTSHRCLVDHATETVVCVSVRCTKQSLISLELHSCRQLQVYHSYYIFASQVVIGSRSSSALPSVLFADSGGMR